MKADNFEKKIWGKISKTSPTPRWQFLLKNYVVWLLAGLALLVGSLAFSVVVYLSAGNDWAVLGQQRTSWLELLLLTLPYFWLLLLAALIFVAYYNIKHTKRGWSYPLSWIIGGSIILSLLFGALFFKAGLGRTIDDVLSQQRGPVYARIFNPRLGFWAEPNEGRLVGLVADDLGDNQFVIIDPEEKSWQVDTTQAEIMLPGSQLIVGKPVKISGQATAEDKFTATTVMSLDFGRKAFRPGMMFDRLDFAKRPEPMPGLFAKYPELLPNFLEHLQTCPECFCRLLQERPEAWQEITKMSWQPADLAKLAALRDNCLAEPGPAVHR